MKKYFWVFIVIIISVFAYFYFQSSDSKETYVTIKPTYGKFVSSVLVSGELRSKNSINIKGPSNARQMNIWQMKINKLVDEGTIVKEGDFVAELDKSEIASQLNEIQLNIEKIQTQYKQKQLDSTLNLSNARNELINLKYTLEQKKLEWEQSVYEPPATQRQAEITYEQTKRSYNQSKENYKTKVQQAIAELKVINTDLSKEIQKQQMIQELLAAFTITAPAEGMIVYAKNWGGRKRTVGSQISAWDPVVATLPDLSKMESVTYVNEIDIQKVKKDQNVKISLDANPDKNLEGIVSSVANIGQEQKKTDAKVFEVIIQIIDKDTTLLPAMTTSNEIIIAEKDSVLFIPIDALYKDEEDNFSYVFISNGTNLFKQEVSTGMMNENEVIIEAGIEQNSEIVLGNISVNSETLETKRLETK
jgi:multidrug efflux pump subunit AcrA (membrane-fusion protein)